jgi:hypothetical protein
MAYVEPDAFEGKDTELVFIAGRTSEAKSVEAVLTQEGIDYTLTPEPFLHVGIFLNRSELPGVGFNVVAAQAPHVRSLLTSRGFQAGVVLGEEA